MGDRQASRGIALVTRVLSSPQFVSAIAIASIGLGVFAELLQRVIGWPGLIAGLVVLVLIASGSLTARRTEIEWQGILPVSMLLFVGWACISIFWSQYQWASLGGIAYLLAFTVLGLCVALSRDTIQIVRSFGDVFRVALVASLLLEVMSGLLIDTPFTFLGVEGNLDAFGPIQGVMGSRNQLGLIALLALITFGTEHRTRSVSRGVGIGSLTLACVSIALSRSPVIWAVVVLVAAAVFALYALRRVDDNRRPYWQLGLVGLALLAVVVAWMFRSPIIAIFSANSELGYRLTIWRGLWDLTARNAIQGWGWIGAWRPEVQPFPAFAILGEREPGSALNAFLDVWFQLGIVGVFLFTTLVVLAFTRSWLLAGRRRSVVFAWPALVLLALLVTSLAESSALIEYGWLLLVVCSVKAAQELSWRRAFAAAPSDPLPDR